MVDFVDAECRKCGTTFAKVLKPGNQPGFCSTECKRSYRAQYFRRWVRNNWDAVQSATAERRKAFKEKDPDYWKRYYAANRESKKKARREWFSENRERALAKAREYAAANPDLIRKIGRKNRQTRRARLKSVFVESVDARVVFKRDKGMCGICMKPVGSDKWHVDHITPIARGGEHSYANSQLAHAKCNQSKGARV